MDTLVDHRFALILNYLIQCTLKKKCFKSALFLGRHCKYFGNKVVRKSPWPWFRI